MLGFRGAPHPQAHTHTHTHTRHGAQRARPDPTDDHPTPPPHPTPAHHRRHATPHPTVLVFLRQLFGCWPTNLALSFFAANTVWLQKEHAPTDRAMHKGVHVSCCEGRGLSCAKVRPMQAEAAHGRLNCCCWPLQQRRGCPATGAPRAGTRERCPCMVEVRQAPPVVPLLGYWARSATLGLDRRLLAVHGARRSFV